MNKNGQNFRQAILDYGELFIAEITKQLLLNNKKATGDLIDSLDYRVIETADTIVLDILANPYLMVVDKGLKPGTFPNVDKIKKWVTTKRLKPKNKKYKTNADLAWAIAKQIDKRGIKPTNILKKAKASFLSNKAALNEVVDAANIDVKAMIKEALKNLNK